MGTDRDLLRGLGVTRNDKTAQWYQNGVLMCSAPASWFDAVIARLGSAPSRSEPIDLERLAEAWGNVMDGRRLGSERIGFSTTTYDDWKAIVAEYDRLAPSRSEPE